LSVLSLRVLALDRPLDFVGMTAKVSHSRAVGVIHVNQTTKDNWKIKDSSGITSLLSL